MKDNKGFVELEGQLTTIGRTRVLENNFDISKFAVSDDGVNYRLINQNVLDPYMVIERSLLFNKNDNSVSHLKNRINKYKLESLQESLFDFDPDIRRSRSTGRLSEVNKVSPVGFKNEINFPLSSRENDILFIKYYITDADVATNEKAIVLTVPEENLPEEMDKNHISVTLHSSEFFDIRLPFTERSEESREINWDSAYFHQEDDQYKRPIKLPKTITMISGGGGNNSFTLLYRGNFKYEGKQLSDFPNYEVFINNTKTHQTFLTIRCENTGLYQDICIQLIKTQGKTTDPDPIMQI